jgi:hypothetical protein
MPVAIPGRTLDLDALVERGDALYESRIKALVEPVHNGKTVAIHLDSGDYALGSNSPTALRALRTRQPKGKVMTMLVGPERSDPTLDRMLARHPSPNASAE